MGDIAEMLSQGILCEECGCIIEDLIPVDGSDTILEPPGCPRKCKECSEKAKTAR